MKLAEEITRILAEEPADHRTLYAYLERNPSTVRKELSRLKAQGKIVRHSNYWTLSDSEHPAKTAYWGVISLILAVTALTVGAYLLGLLHGGL